MINDTLEIRAYRVSKGVNESVEIDGEVYNIHPPKVLVFPNISSLCEWVTTTVVQSLSGNSDGIILPTGTTPLPLYAFWRESKSTMGHLLQNRPIANPDEHWPLNPTENIYHQIAYMAYALRELIHPLGIPLENHIIPNACAKNPYQEAARVAQEIANLRWKISILGLGPDATEQEDPSSHIFFIPPGTSPQQTVLVADLDEATRAANSGYAHIPTHQYVRKGITMGPKDIARSTLKILMATTANKQQNLADLLTGPFDPKKSSSHLLLMPGVVAAVLEEAYRETRRRKNEK